MTTIAVVTACFNQGRTLTETLDSILGQTRPPGDVVIVNDGSTDLYTRRVFATVNHRSVRVVHTENRGLRAALNLGVQSTSSDYLLIIDADDLIDPAFLEVTGGLLDAHADLDFVSTGVRGFGDAEYTYVHPGCDLVTALTRGTVRMTSLMRRRVWEETGGFDESFDASGDRDFWITALERGFKGRIIDAPLFWYRVRADSMHHRRVADGTFYADSEAVLRKHRQTIEHHGLDIVLAKQGYIHEQHSNHEELMRRTSELELEAAEIERDIASAVRSLRDMGHSNIDWGELAARAPLRTTDCCNTDPALIRYYEQQFLNLCGADLRGSILEISDATSGQVAAFVSSSDSTGFDCVVLRALHQASDAQRLLASAASLLKPAGVLLGLVPCISSISRRPLTGMDYCRFTEAALRRMCATVCDPRSIEIRAFGSVLTAAMAIHGLTPADLTREELERHDPHFPVLYGVRALKTGDGADRSLIESTRR
jgi:glycosyltransferase involved in cell wall biosynthesis